MKLSKQDALFLYGILFNHNKHEHNSWDNSSRCSRLLEELESFVLGANDESSQEDEDESGFTSENQKEEPESEDTVDPDTLAGLPSITVKSPTGSKVDLEFEDVGDESSVDVLLDEGSMIIDSVTHVKLTEKTVELYDGSEWHVFDYKKPPKTWSKTLKANVVYGVGQQSTDDESEEE